MMHLPSMAYCSYYQYPFYPCKWLAYTSPNASSKWEITESGKVRLHLFAPAIWMKRIWIRKVTRIAMHDILTHQNNRTSRYNVLIDFIITFDLPAYSPCWWIKTHGFSKTFSVYSNFGISSTVGTLSLPLFLTSIDHSSSYSLGLYYPSLAIMVFSFPSD